MSSAKNGPKVNVTASALSKTRNTGTEDTITVFTDFDGFI